MIKTNKKSKILYGYITINYLWLTTIILCLTSLTMLSNSQVQSEKFQINTGVEDEIREKATEFIKKNQLDKAIALYNSALENYKHDWNLINFVVTNKFLLYKQARRYEDAEKTLNDMRTLYTEPTVGRRKTPANLVIETSISNKLIQLYRESRQYDRAVKMTEHWMEVYKEKIEKSDYESETEKALDLLQAGPACIADVYSEWGKYDLARKYYQEQIDYLNKITTKLFVLSKLDERYRFAWEEMNARVVLPLEIAKCYEKEGKTEKALESAEQVLKTLKDTAFKSKYEKFSSEKRRIESLRDKDLIPLMTRCKSKLK